MKPERYPQDVHPEPQTAAVPTLLTLLGVLIGCCSIVIMVSIGIGMAESQNRMLAEMGDLTIITVTPKQNGKGKIKLNDSALGQIRHMELVLAVTPKLNWRSMNAPSPLGRQP